MPTSAERYWKTEAAVFDRFYHAEAHLLHRLVHRFLLDRFNLIARLSAEMTPGQFVADVGCGSGLYMGLVLSRGAKVTGIDYSQQMLSLAGRHLQTFDPAQYELKEGDAKALPLADHTCDWVLAIGLLDYVEELEAVLKEIRRVLKPGGQAILTFPKSPSPFFFIRNSFVQPLRRVLLGLPPLTNILTRSQVNQVLADAGLTIQHLSSLQATMWLVKVN